MKINAARFGERCSLLDGHAGECELADTLTADRVTEAAPARPEPGVLWAVREQILTEVNAERDRQDAKWGGVPGIDRHDDHTYAAVLGEEFGEACQAWIERDALALRAELVQTAAVAVAWIEEIDNGGMLRA